MRPLPQQQFKSLRFRCTIANWRGRKTVNTVAQVGRIML